MTLLATVEQRPELLFDYLNRPSLRFVFKMNNERSIGWDFCLAVASDVKRLKKLFIWADVTSTKQFVGKRFLITLSNDFELFEAITNVKTFHTFPLNGDFVYDTYDNIIKTMPQL